jgi:catechol 2,3-dioxygenase-like lactoylglutathione lyase family enzyme
VIVDLVPFILVSDVARSIAFYEALGFAEVKRHEANVDEVPVWDPDESSPGFLYLYTRDIEAFRRELLRRGIEAGEIEDGPGPGPNRQLCVRDPDGHGHMVAELFEGSVGSEPPR